jgi:NitT/TauT family transport system substrate-binding protein
MLTREGMTPDDVEIVEMPPPDMPAALYANAVDAYCTGEPFGAAAQAAGTWLDQSPANRDKAADIAGGKAFFNQNPKIIKFVMENPQDRVTYGDLRMIREEFDELMQLSLEARTLKKPIAYERYVDDSFVKSLQPLKLIL